MAAHPEIIPGSPASGVLIVVDHASAHVPPDIDLGIDPALLATHIAVDIGAAEVTRCLAARLDAPAILAGVSRLVIDLNREEAHPGLVPLASDGRPVPGNRAADAATRIDRFHRPWHDAIAAAIAAGPPRLILAVHSFTPRLDTAPEEARPWEIGLLYNRNDRAPRLALPFLAARGIVAGDNQPYSGRLLNATMDRHAEANGVPYLAIEIRNDLIRDPAGVAHWCGVIAGLARHVLAGLASQPDPGP